MIQIESVESPFTAPLTGFQAVTTVGRADAMGLVPREEKIEALDLPSLQIVIRYVHKAGIGRTFQLDLEDEAGIERVLRNINAALEESPSPEFEWTRMLEVLGLDLLAQLLGLSLSSVRRYSAAARTTPDEVAGRLHFLSLLVGDLNGAYNEIGVRQWFHRSRVQLGGRAPSDLLKGRWMPREPGPMEVQNLARSLTASPAT
jgi:hypothetical protein